MQRLEIGAWSSNVQSQARHGVTIETCSFGGEKKIGDVIPVPEYLAHPTERGSPSLPNPMRDRWIAPQFQSRIGRRWFGSPGMHGNSSQRDGDDTGKGGTVNPRIHDMRNV